MPSVNTPEGLADLITTTLPELGRLNFTQIAQSLQQFPVMQFWLKKDKVVMESDGLTIRRNLMQRTGQAAAFTGITDSDNVGIPTLMSFITVPWRHAQTAWAYHYQTDMLMNRGKAVIIKIIQPRRLGALLDKAKVLERAVGKGGLTLKGSIGVGDTESDIVFLKMVERPICFNPARGLYKFAKKQKWEVIVERKDVIYKI